LPVVRAPEVSKMAGLLRGISFDPDVPGRDARFEPAIPQLDVTPEPDQLPASDDQTEGLLNAMIGECHFLMRAVAFPSMCHARVADDRLTWMGKAMQLAETGATVAKAVARLRHGPTIRESHQKITVENKVAVVQGGGGARFRENNLPTARGGSRVQPKGWSAARQSQRPEDRPAYRAQPCAPPPGHDLHPPC
jgi:hypothetical protein